MPDGGSRISSGWKLAAGCAVAAVVAGGLVVGLSRGGGSSPRIVSGAPELTGTAPAPVLAGPDLVTGKRFTLADFRGKPVFINYWASWCGPCREEAPEIKRFTEARPDVVMIGVNLNDVRRTAQAFSARVGWTHPSIFDPGGTVGTAALRVVTLPVTFYVDAQGTVRGRTDGPVTYAELISAADRI